MKLHELMADENNRGIVFQFTNDLNNPNTNKIKYMVVNNGILDLNTRFDVISVGNLINEEVITLGHIWKYF